MEPIRPIHEVEETAIESNLKFQPVLPDLQEVNEAKLQVDAQRLRNDPDYLNQMIKYIHDKARMFYNSFNYTAAEGLYESFFRYLKTYRPSYGMAPPPGFWPALFEYSWILHIQKGTDESQKVLNEELIHLIEPDMSLSKAPSNDIRETIVQLELKDVLPTNKNLTIPVSPEDLVKLAQVYTQAGEAEVAIQLLKHAEIRHLMGLHVINDLLLNRFHQKQEEITLPSPLYNHLPFGYSHTGLPVAPILPIAPEAMKALRSQAFLEGYHVDHIEPTSVINPDPHHKKGSGH